MNYSIALLFISMYFILMIHILNMHLKTTNLTVYQHKIKLLNEKKKKPKP